MLTDIKQDRQCTYNVTLRPVCQPFLQRKSNEYYTVWVCICSLRYPVCSAHVPYCNLWPVPLHYIFPHYFINVTIFGKKKVIEHKMCVLIFSITFVWNISRSKKNWARYDKKIYISLHVKYPLFLSDFKETRIFATNFREIVKYKISWKSVQWEPSRSRRTDRRTHMTKQIMAFRSFAVITHEFSL